MKRKIKIVLIIVLAALMIISLFGCSGEGRLKRSGNGSAVVYLDKTAYSERIEASGSAQTYFESVMYNMNLSSGDEDVLKILSLEETADSYILKIGFRRVNNIKGIGEFTWDDFDRVSVPEDAMGLRIQSYSRGNLRCSVQRNYDGNVGMVDIKPGAALNHTFIKPQTASGQELDAEQFTKGAEGSKDKLITFRLMDTQGIQKIHFSLQGTVRFYSSEGIRLLSDNEIELIPSEYTVDQTRYENQTDADVNPVLDENGNVVKNPEFYANQKVNCCIGWFVFKQAVSPVLVGALVVLGGGIVAFVLWGTVGGKFKKIAQSEKFRLVKSHKLLYAMLIPGLAFLIVFSYLPMFGLIAGFQEFRLSEGFFNSEFVGMKHFASLFRADDETVYRVFRNTIFISIIRIATNFPMILLFALVLNAVRNKYVKSVVQTMSYMPNFVSWVVVGGMMYGLFSIDYGMINQVIVRMGGQPIHWYAESDYWWWILAGSSLWKSMGWGTIIYMSALASIDSELYDACMIDGGGAFRKTTTVTLPGIMNIVMLQLIMDAGNVLRDNYEQILAVTNGSPGISDKVTVIGTLTFNAALSGNGLSVATALGLIQGLIGLMLVLLVNNVAKKSGNAGIL